MSMWRCSDCLDGALHAPGPFCPACGKAGLIAVIMPPIRVLLINGKARVFRVEMIGDVENLIEETEHGHDPSGETVHLSARPKTDRELF